MIGKVSDSWNVGILIFLVLLGMMVSLINKAGGSAAYGRWASQHIKTRAGAIISTAFLGMLIREATGLPVTVYHGMTPGASVPLTPHGWVTVEQDGVLYAYDAELPKFSGFDVSRCYKVNYAEASTRLYVQGVGTNLY